MTIKRTFDCSKDAFLNQPNRGNGAGDILVVGPVAGNRNRVVATFPADWTGGVTGVISALLGLRVDGSCFTQGGAVAMHVERIADATTYTEGKRGAGSDSCGAFTDNGVVYPGPASVTTHRVDYNPGVQPNAGDWISIDITQIVQDCYAENASAVKLKLYADTIAGGNEDLTTRTIVFSSRSKTADKAPRITVVLNDNHTPTPPTVTLVPTVAGSSPPLMGSYSGKTVPVLWRQNDVDGNDWTAKRQHAFYGQGATDATPGAPYVDTGAIISNGSPTRATDLVTGLPTRTTMRERSRTQDQKGAWSPWTPLANGICKTAFIGRAPSNPFFQNTTTVNPTIAGSIVSADPGDFVTAYEVEVLKDRVAGAAIAMWTPGPQQIGGTSTRAQVSYGGLDIQPGDNLRWRHRIYGRDGVPGDWSSYYHVRFYPTTGPSAMSPTDTSTKLTSRTPTLTIADAAAFDRYRWLLYRAGAVIYDSGSVAIGSTTTTGVAIPAALANWGDTLSWSAAIRHTGNSALEAFSPLYDIYIDALPGTTLAVTS